MGKLLILTILRMVGYGDNAGSGFPMILNAWKMENWRKPDLVEDTELNRMSLKMSLNYYRA